MFMLGRLGSFGIIYNNPELVSNGTFNTDLTGWTLSLNAPTATWDAGRMKIVGSSASAGRYRDIILDSNKTYTFLGTITTDALSNQACFISLRQGGAGGFSSIAGISDISATIGNTTSASRTISGRSLVRIFCVTGYSSSGGIAYYDNISIKRA